MIPKSLQWHDIKVGKTVIVHFASGWHPRTGVIVGVVENKVVLAVHDDDGKLYTTHKQPDELSE